MIRVTVEMIPHGDETRKSVLGSLEIANDNTGNYEIGNYDATLHAEYTRPEGRKCRVTGFGRQRQSVWSLIGAALKQMGHTKHASKG